MQPAFRKICFGKAMMNTVYPSQMIIGSRIENAGV